MGNLIVIHHQHTADHGSVVSSGSSDHFVVHGHEAACGQGVACGHRAAHGQGVAHDCGIGHG